MNANSPSGRAALVGLLVGGAAGFLLIEVAGVLFAFVLGRSLALDGTGEPPPAVLAVPVVCAVIGAVAGARLAGRDPRSGNRG
ncbi:hypothetical protein [Thermomonospora amylolytica]|uniref:hypothetical protein n=1 Tax=Thermomonospora amylolytica TaxID=1411117 RepID=UPI000E6B66BF|nr:hypothetical protein [Thermomonospora amylolytica]